MPPDAEMVRTIVRRVAAVVLVAGTVMVAVPAAAQAPDIARVDGALRRLDVQDIDGMTWTFEKLRGRVVLIDFWATWCAPCLAEIPTMRQARSRHPGKFEILGVSLDRRSRRDVAMWLKRQGVDWPQVHDGRGFTGELALAFDIVQLPTSVLVDHHGRVRAFTPRGEQLLAAVDTLVAEMEAEETSGEIDEEARR